jgi:ligand-binding sensor domain-containing protein
VGYFLLQNERYHFFWNQPNDWILIQKKNIDICSMITQLLKLFIFQIIFLCIALTAQAQEPHYRQFTEEDGLPSGTLYSTIQDSKGYIWVSSADGIARYDGQKFERFTTQNGLLKNEVWHFFEDNYGHIWLQSNFNAEMKLQYFDIKSNQIVTLQLPADKVLHRKHKIQSLATGQLVFEMIDNQTIGIYLRSYSDDRNAYFYAFVKPLATGVAVVNAPKTFIDLYPKKTPISGFSVTDRNGTIWRFWNNKWQVFCKTKNIFTNQTQMMSSQRLFLNDSITVFSAGADVIRWHSRRGFLNKYRVASSALSFIDSKSKNLILIDTNNETILLDNQLKPTEYIANFDFLNAWRAKTVLVDKQQNLWVTTHENTLRMVSKQALVHSQNYDFGEAVRHIGKDPTGRLWIGMQSGKVLYGRTGEKWQEANLATPFTQFIRGMACMPNGDLWIVNDRQIAKINVNKSILPQKIILKNRSNLNLNLLQVGVNDDFVVQGGAYKSVKMAQNKIWITTSGAGYGVESIKNTYHFSEATNGRCYALQPSSKGLFIGRLDGLYLQTDSPRLIKAIPQKDISDLTLVKNELYVATQSEGLYCYDITTGKATKIKGIGNDNIHKLEIDNNQNTWACSQKEGLIKVVNSQVVQKITIADGLPTNDVFDVLVENKQLIIATAKGITTIKLPIEVKKTNEELISLILKSVRFNHSGRDSTLIFPDNKQKLVLKSEENNLGFEVNNLDYHSPKSALYQYVLFKNNDTVSILTKSAQIHELRFLESGNYRLVVSTANDAPIFYDFEILKPFYLRWWFWFAVGGLLAAFVYYRVRQNMKRASMELRILQGQMNAHFAANFMESVKELILKGERVQAFDLLSIFGRMMQRFVRASRDKHIEIKDEVEFLNQYMRLATLVYGLKKTEHYDKTLYATVTIAEGVNPKSHIPPLLVQPILENAFKYGINNKPAVPSRIRIVFEPHTNTTVKCTVEDDGVGRDFIKQMHIEEESDFEEQTDKEAKKRKGSIEAMREAGLNLTVIDLPQGTRVEMILTLIN